jgi:hypothetical protein
LNPVSEGRLGTQPKLGYWGAQQPEGQSQLVALAEDFDSPMPLRRRPGLHHIGEIGQRMGYDRHLPPGHADVPHV